MKIALAQINSTVGDLPGNCAKIVDFYRRGCEAGATMVMVPELAITGYPPRDLLAKRRFVDDNLRALDELKASVGEAALLVGYVDVNPKPPGKDYFNAAALIHHGQIVARRFKSLLPTYDVFDEDRYFQSAASNATVEFEGDNFGLTICEDIWNDKDYGRVHYYQHDPVAELMKAHANYLLNISASPYHLGKEQLRHEMLSGVAAKHRIPLAYCNLVGGNDELIFDGNSMVFDAAGKLIARGAAFAEDLIVVDLDATKSIPFQPQQQVAGAPRRARARFARLLRKSVVSNRSVLGLSGGVDSAVTACLAVAALGRENVMSVSLPSQFSSKGSIEDARELAKNLGIR